MIRLLLGITAVVAILVAASAYAEHNSVVASADEGPDGRPSSTTRGSLDIDLKLGFSGFRLGGRLFGREGYAGGAWLNGETRKDGFSLDGRVEREGKAWNFRMNADVDEWLRRAARWWGISEQ